MPDESVGDKSAGCATCGEKVEWSEPAEVVVLWFPALPRPITVIVGTEVHVCIHCKAVLQLFDRVQDALPPSKAQPFPWQYGEAIFRDGTLIRAQNPRAGKIEVA